MITKEKLQNCRKVMLDKEFENVLYNFIFTYYYYFFNYILKLPGKGQGNLTGIRNTDN